MVWCGVSVCLSAKVDARIAILFGLENLMSPRNLVLDATFAKLLWPLVSWLAKIGDSYSVYMCCPSVRLCEYP